MATIRDIAGLLQLSPATVSRALHDPDSPFVSERTRARVKEAARTLGYTPNVSGRALATGRSNLLSFWVNDPYTAYYAMVGRHLYAEASRRGYHPVMRTVSTQTDERVMWQAPDSLAEGLLALDVCAPLRKCLEECPGYRLPIVALGALCLETVDHVRVDLRTGAADAVRHLVETRNGPIIALLYRADDPRTDAYEDVMRASGREPEILWIPDETRATSRAFVREHVREHGPPSAFFCQNDDVAIAASRGLLDLGIRVPDDVALVGCDGIEDGEFQAVPLSTIVHPVEEMCRTAFEYLTHRMRQPDAPLQGTVLQSRLVVRASSA